jgi:integrase
MTRHAEGVTRDSYLTDDELVNLYSWAWVHQDHPKWSTKVDVVRAVLGFGPRVSELTQLLVADCSPDGMVQIRNGKGKIRRRADDGTFSRPGTPHHRQVRVMPEYLPHYLSRLGRAKAEESVFFFSKPNGEAYHRRTFWLWWSEVLEAAGIRHLKFHAGRHTYATWEIATRRLQPHEVQAQLGHLDVSMTLGQYTHSVTEMLYQEGPPKWREVALEGPIKQRWLRAV